MDLFSTTSLATGGIAAAAIALWGQVRQVCRYLSSFAVVSAKLSPDLTPPVLYHLHQRYQLVPSGLVHYTAIAFYLRHLPRELTVPFRTPGPQEIYRKGWRLLFVNHTGSYTLRALRGTIDFNALVSAALDDYDGYLIGVADQEDRPSDFRVLHVLGRDKDAGAAGFGNMGQTVSSLEVGPASAPPKQPADPPLFADPGYLTSFKYARSAYMVSSAQKPFDTLFFSPDVLRHVEQAKQWFHMRHWYADRGIPWRRGWLLHGPAGTGKSSLARAVAQHLGIPLLHYHLGTLSDREFLNRWKDMPTPCVVLFEDVDAVFNGRTSLTEHKLLSFDTILNALSGVDSPNGVFLIVTTNHPDLVDPALGVAVSDGSSVSTRPGRIDSVIEVGLISADNRRRMASHILRDWPDLIAGLVEKGEGLSPDQFQEMCLQQAYSCLRDTPELQSA